MDEVPKRGARRCGRGVRADGGAYVVDRVVPRVLADQPQEVHRDAVHAGLGPLARGERRLDAAIDRFGHEAGICRALEEAPDRADEAPVPVLEPILEAAGRLARPAPRRHARGVPDRAVPLDEQAQEGEVEGRREREALAERGADRAPERDDCEPREVDHAADERGGGAHDVGLSTLDGAGAQAFGDGAERLLALGAEVACGRLAALASDGIGKSAAVLENAAGERRGLDEGLGEGDDLGGGRPPREQLAERRRRKLERASRGERHVAPPHERLAVGGREEADRERRRGRQAAAAPKRERAAAPRRVEARDGAVVAARAEDERGERTRFVGKRRVGGDGANLVAGRARDERAARRERGPVDGERLGHERLGEATRRPGVALSGAAREVVDVRLAHVGEPLREGEAGAPPADEGLRVAEHPRDDDRVPRQLVDRPLRRRQLGRSGHDLAPRHPPVAPAHGRVEPRRPRRQHPDREQPLRPPPSRYRAPPLHETPLRSFLLEIHRQE